MERGDALAEADPLNLADNVMLPDELQLLVKQHALCCGIFHFPLQDGIFLGSLRHLHANQQNSGPGRRGPRHAQIWNHSQLLGKVHALAPGDNTSTVQCWDYPW